LALLHGWLSGVGVQGFDVLLGDFSDFEPLTPCLFVLKLFFLCIMQAPKPLEPAMNIHIDLSALQAMLGNASLEQLLAVAVLLLAAAILVLAWKLNK